MSNDKKCQNVLQVDEVFEVLKKKLGNNIFRLNDFVIQPASENPMGFLGEHYRITAEVTLEDETKNFSFFVKKIPTEVPQHLEYALKTRAFYKEIELYKTLFADLKHSQKNTENATKWCPEYYYSRGSDLFVLEDLCDAGYYMFPVNILMDEEHVKVSLETLAAMHAASFVFEDQYNSGNIQTSSPHWKNADGKRATVGEIYSHLTFETEASDEKGHPGNTYHNAGVKSLVMLADMLTGYTLEEKKKIKEELPNILTHYFELVKTSEKFKNVFVHGDLWANNILFRKNAEGKVSHGLIIDFQLTRYAPPAHDVMMFLHLVQDNKFRQERQQDMLKHYYCTFTKELEKNCLKTEDILPWDTFLESCEFYEDLGLICTLFYFQLILAPSEITKKFLSSPDLFTKNMLVDRSEMVVECFLKDDLCRSRVTESLKDVIKKFILV